MSVDLTVVPLPPARHCEVCGKRMAHANHGTLCFVCQRLRIEAALQADVERNPVTMVAVRRKAPPKPRKYWRMTEQQRQEVLAALGRMTIKEVAAHFGVSPATVSNVVRRAPERPNCPYGCGSVLHAGVCGKNPNRLLCGPQIGRRA